MILIKFILLKNITNSNIRNNTLLDTILLIKQLTNFYILFYTQAILKHNILFITNIDILKNKLQILHLLTSNAYIYHNKIQGLLSNWKMLQKQIFLLKWLFFIIYFINSKKLKFSFYNLIRLFKLFLKLKKNYWGVVNLITIPNYIFILSDNIPSSLIKDSNIYGTQIFFITINQYMPIIKNKLLIKYNIKYFKLFLEFINTAYIQGHF